MDAEVFVREAIYLRINHKKIKLEFRRMIDTIFISGLYRSERIHLAKMSFPFFKEKRKGIIMLDT